MSNNTATRKRPTSPHLQVYRFIPTMAMSILHRITGSALYFGALLVAWWIVAAATSPEWLATANWALGSWLGLLVLIGFTWALWFHLIGGLRHVMWDTGYAMEKHTATMLAWATLASSLVLTALTWAVYFITL